MIGRVVSHYKIMEKLGGGGMGVVYKAEDMKLKRTVALKFLLPQTLGTPDEKTRFVHEAQAAAALDHPNICMVHEIDEVDEESFIVMSYLDGQSLKEKIKAGPLKLDEAVSIAIEIARGLQEAHNKGIVHRDIKSANIMLTESGHVKITDFGLAKLAGGTQVTKPGVSVGTVAYMSPEQARGEETDHRTDIWSLGVLLYEMITGQLPFRGDHTHAVLYLLANEDPTPLTGVRTGVPMELERIVKKAMAKKNAERYQSVDDMIVDLMAVLRDVGIDAPASSAGLASTGSGTSQHSPWILSRAAKIVIGIGVLLVLVLAIGKVFLFQPSAQAVNSIAVLPLDNRSQDPEQEFFVDGMTDVLIASLAKMGNLRVISRTSVMRYKDTQKTLPAIARELNVDAVLEGSVMRSGSRVRITAQLIHAATDEHIWADNYERELRDVLALQSDVALAIANQIVLTLTAEEQTRLANAPSVDPAAFEAYMRGRFHWNKRTPSHIVKGLEYFEQAVAIDPDYALAYVGIAESYNLCVTYQILPVEEAVPKAKQAAKKALQLDGTLGEAQSVIAAVTDKECKFYRVIDDYARAVRMSPNYGTARQWYAEALSRLGRHEEAIEQIYKAQALDPFSLPINTSVGEIFYNNRKYEVALEATLKAMELDPDFPAAVGLTAKILDMQSVHNEAIEYYKKYMTLAGIDPDIIEMFGRAYEQGGMDGARQWYTKNFRQAAIGQLTLGYSLALGHAMLGEKEQALEWLERLSDDHCWNVADIGVEPMFDSLRNDQRYTRLLRKVGLEE